MARHQLALTLINRTARHLRRQRRLNVLGFFLPLGVALGLGGGLLLASVSWPLVLLLAPLGVWAFLLWTALRHTRHDAEHQNAAALLDERTLGKERFLTLATLSQPQAPTGLKVDDDKADDDDRLTRREQRPLCDHPSKKSAASTLVSLLERDTARRAAFFVPERDVPFRLDRRVPIGLLVSGLCVAGAFGLFMLSSQPISALLSPVFDLSQQPLRLSELEKKAHELATQGETRPEREAGAALLSLVERLKAPELSRQEKERLIEETQQRLRLDIQLPQLLPQLLSIDLVATQGRHGQDGAGDDQQSQGDRQNSSATEGTGRGPGRRDDKPAAGGRNRQAEPPQQAGGGIQFEPPEQRGEKKPQSDQGAGGTRRTASQHDPTQHTQAGDPDSPGGQRGQDPSRPGLQSDPNRTQPTGSGTGPGQGPAPRFGRAGEKVGGFLTRDARFVKVRVPAGDTGHSDTGERTPNASPARPITPYSNAPLTDQTRDSTPAGQPIPLEYRPILEE